jgi:hypothetical protein
MNELLTCSGCGVKLQTEDSGRVGYIPEQALQRTPTVCQRCFRIKHYNEAASVTLDQDQFLRILSGIAETQALVVHIVDIFDFEGSLIGGLHRFVGTNPVLLVVNKLDLLPQALNWNRVKNWVQKQAKDNGLRPIDVVMVSAKKGKGFDQLAASLDYYRDGKDIYIVGATNTGKSTLINQLIRSYSDLDMELTVSRYPGTTLDIVRIPLAEGQAILDTPGIVYPYRMTEIVDVRTVNQLLPDKTIKPVVYQLDPRQTLFFGALARMDFVQGEHQSFTCYVSGSIKIHRTKLERADELYAEHRGELLTPPEGEAADKLVPLMKHTFKIPRGAKHDISISGLGWIQVNGVTGAYIDVHAPKGIKVTMRPSLMG